jgi:hypothetical protein
MLVNEEGTLKSKIIYVKEYSAVNMVDLEDALRRYKNRNHQV